MRALHLFFDRKNDRPNRASHRSLVLFLAKADKPLFGMLLSANYPLEVLTADN